MRLRADLERSLKAEDYLRAAVIKKEMDSLEQQDPVCQLERQLQAAVAEERYKDAAQLKVQLEQAKAAQSLDSLEPHEPTTATTVSTMSDTVTNGVRVRVRSFYIPQNSFPSQRQYLFGYHVEITNESNKVVQLRNRHWVITDEHGHQQEARGPGVVGHQPVLLPGKVFEYESACPLTCPSGTMEGSYQFVVLNEASGHFSDMLEVLVGKFKLTTQHQDK